MKQIFTFLAVSLAVAAHAQITPTAPAPLSPDEQALVQLEAEFAKAFTTGDKKRLDELIAADLFNLPSTATRAQRLSSGKPFDADVFEVSGVSARVWGDAGVTKGFLTTKNTNQPEAETRYYTFTNTFVKRQNTWQQVATHYSPTQVWRVRPMKDNELTTLKPLDCNQESALRSLNQDVPAYFKLTNATNQPITSYWIDREGKRGERPEQKITIQPGESRPYNTFLTRPLVITDANGKCLGIYMASKEPGLVVIK